MKKKEMLKKRMTILKDSIKQKRYNKHYLAKHILDDNTACIDILLPNDFEIFNKLAPSTYNQLNPEIYQYIDEHIYFIPSEYDITINFIGKTFSLEQKEQITSSLHEHYNLNVADKLDDIYRNRLLGIFLLIFGVISLTLYFFLSLFNNNLLILEIISIVGTFSVWESVNCWLIQGHRRRLDLHNALQSALIKIIFTENKKGL